MLAQRSKKTKIGINEGLSGLDRLFRPKWSSKHQNYQKISRWSCCDLRSVVSARLAQERFVIGRSAGLRVFESGWQAKNGRKMDVGIWKSSGISGLQIAGKRGAQLLSNGEPKRLENQHQRLCAQG